MRDMLERVLENMPESPARLVAMMIFFVTFVGIALWTYRKSGRKHYDEMAKLPLDER
jgi:cbb3-type cytochrome oxidase subunit 3